ncbi:MAG: DUF4430 domain-containing protein [Clostridiaceae bacterium]
MKKRILISVIFIILCSSLFYLSFRLNNESKNQYKKNIASSQSKQEDIVNEEESIKDKDIVKESEEEKIQTNEEDTPKEEIETDENTISETNSDTQTKTKSDEEQAIEVEPEPQPEPEKKVEPKVNNVKIVNETSNGVTDEIILETYVDFANRSVYDITIEALDNNSIQKKAIAGYFSSIAGLKERDAGPSSGWIFYVNGVKSSVGSKDEILKSDDKLLWIYKKDGFE